MNNCNWALVINVVNNGEEREIKGVRDGGKRTRKALVGIVEESNKLANVFFFWNLKWIVFEMYLETTIMCYHSKAYEIKPNLRSNIFDL